MLGLLVFGRHYEEYLLYELFYRQPWIGGHSRGSMILLLVYLQLLGHCHQTYRAIVFSLWLGMTILYKILDSQLCARGHIIGASCLLNDHFGLELYFEDYLIEEIAELFFVIAHSFFMNVGRFLRRNVFFSSFDVCHDLYNFEAHFRGENHWVAILDFVVIVFVCLDSPSCA